MREEDGTQTKFRPQSGQRLCSVSVDLDGLRCYTRIHALAEPEGPDPIYAFALPRFLRLFEELGVRATFFVVGEDALVPERAALLREAVDAGHELANHSATHPYGLPSLDDTRLRAELVDGHEAIRRGCGVECVGFRAPGYNIDARAISVAEELGYLYDSSIFPCPPYYLAKAAVMGAIRLTGRRSRSSMVDPRTQLAPIHPYRPRRDAVHQRGFGPDGAGLVELPMCVLPGVRVPVIGTSLIMAGPSGASLMMQTAARTHRQLVSVELHGIDLADADCDGIAPELRRVQPDLRHDLARKLAVFRAAFSALAGRTRFVPCAEAARTLSPDL